MTTTPYLHQQRFIDKNPNRALLNWEMRTGKSLPAALWIDNPCRAGNTYIICKKQNKKDWLRYNTKATVWTKEEFKKLASTVKSPTAFVIDEIHNFSSPLFTKNRSQLSGALYKILKEYPNCDVLGLTATPVRNNAWSLHTLLCFIGVYYDWKTWRDEFFELKRMPFLTFAAYFPRPNWRANIDKYLKRHCDIVSLKDIVEYLPEAQTRIITLKQPKYVAPKDRVTTWVEEHYHEQQGKIKEILELGYKKLIIVCRYTYQIEELKKELEDYKTVYVLDGRTKDADEIKRQAQESEECYFIVQSECGEGWDGYMFGAMVFVSMSHSCVSHTQMLGRQRHPEHLKITETIYMQGGRWDRKVYDCVMAGQNFNPHNQ